MPTRTARTPFVTAAEAAALLGVRRASLYAYVSRGRVRVAAHPSDPRARLYSLADIDVLLDRKAHGRRPAEAAAAALNWGLPVLETRVSRIADGRLFYRDEDAIRLSGHGALEDVARLLWECGEADPFRPAKATSFRPAWQRGDPIGCAIVALSEIEPTVAKHRRPSDIVQSAAILRFVAAAAVGAPLPAGPVHRAIARAWERPDAADHIRRALVLVADHELNASTFAARVVASTGASLSMCVIAGLAALSGPRHGGATAEVAAFFDECARRGRGAAIRRRRARDRALPGFGHRLYPEGDPRAAALLAACPPPPPLAAILDAVAAATGVAPNVDAALVVLERAHRLPAGAALVLFAIGRTVGWLAHAMEQRATGQLIRPRAAYVAAAPPRR